MKRVKKDENDKDVVDVDVAMDGCHLITHQKCEN